MRPTTDMSTVPDSVLESARAGFDRAISAGDLNPLFIEGLTRCDAEIARRRVFAAGYVQHGRGRLLRGE